MKTSTKRLRSLLACVVCVCMLVATLPMTVIAAGSGDGDTGYQDMVYGGYLMTNIADEEGNLQELGLYDTTTVEFTYVGLFNAFHSAWSQLSSEGEKVAKELTEAAAACDGAYKTAPDDYTNEAKIYAVSSVVMGEENAPAGDTALTKLQTLELLYNIRDCVESVSYADEELAEKVGSDAADMTQYYGNIYDGTGTINTGIIATTDEAYLVRADYAFTDVTIGAKAEGTLGSTAAALTSPFTALDGAEAAGMGAPENGDGMLYNATFRNAYYREGIGSAISIVGKNTDVTMTSTDGSLVLSGAGGSMAGTAYVAFGASLKITNAVAYSSNQHLTNNLYNGTIHYIDSMAIGGGRVYSSDFWGGYQVYEDTIANGGNVTDEPTTLIVKNSVYGTSVGGNGFASQYFENSVLNVGGASFQNTTSVITDTGSLTLVNSVMNSSGSTLISVTMGENAILTLVDSTVNLSGNGLASLGNKTGINHSGSVTPGDPDYISDAYADMFDSEIIIYLYGDNTITTTDGTLTASIADGASLMIYGSLVDEDGNPVVVEGATVMATDGYGTLTVLSAATDEDGTTPAEPTPDSAVVVEDVDDEEIVEVIEDVEEVEIAEDVEDEEIVEDIEEIEIAEDIEDIEDVEDEEIVAITEDAEDEEVVEDVEIQALDVAEPLDDDDDEEPGVGGGEGGGDQGGPGGSGMGPGGEGGGMGGGQGGGASVEGLLSLSQYVFVASQNEIHDGSVSATYYGVYEAADDIQYAPTGSAGQLVVYLDSDLTEAAEGVTAAISGSTITISGVSTTDNVVYYVANVDGSDDVVATTIYVVNSENSKNAATLYLADDTSIVLTTYAPNMANGSYKAIVGENEINGETSVYIGANRTARSVDDFSDLAGASAKEKEIAAWWLTAGVTNSGASLTEFGDEMFNFEYAMAMYRMFQLVNEEMTFAADYDSSAGGYVSGMGSNDQFSDGADATISCGIWNGIYTTMTSTPVPTLNDATDMVYGQYLLQNIDGVTELGLKEKTTVETLYVGLFNAFQSAWSQLNEKGEAVADELTRAAAIYDGRYKTAPDDYTNAAKITAVAEVIMGDPVAPSAGTELSKLEAITVLYKASDCVESVSYPDSELAAATGSSLSDMTQYYGNIYTGEGEITTGIIDTTDEAYLVRASYDFENETIGALAEGSLGSYGASLTHTDTGIDGMEAMTGTGNDDPGVIYNATFRNAYYRQGIGSAMSIVGKDTHVTMTSDDGTLVISGKGGSMSGTAYVAYGASLQITNAVAFSSSQHLTNNLYNGTIHYIDSLAVGSGRVYSSDFWGGYQVYEDTVANGGNVTDEPTTLIVKNSVYGNSIGGNGYASQYFENSVLNVGGAMSHNTTSLISDTYSLTLVNSVMNSSGSYLLSLDMGEKGIVTLVDSTLNMSSNTLVTLSESTTSGNGRHGNDKGNDADYDALYYAHAAVYVYGDNVLYTPDGTLTAVKADDESTITIYGNVIINGQSVSSVGDATVVSGDEYGTLTVLSGETTMGSQPSNLNGILSLSQYVFVDGQGEIDNGSVSASYYGVYEPDDEVQYAPTGDAASVAVWCDKDATVPAGVTAEIVDGALVLSGVATEGNVVYYLTVDDADTVTTIYVVNDEYADNATLTLADGTTMGLTTYAPNMANGDYTAIVGENEINGSVSVYIGANRTARSVDDYADLAGATDEELAAAAWWLSSGITNSGDTLDTFGDSFYNFELTMAFYRMFQLVNDQMTVVTGFAMPSDYMGGAGQNDQYSDGVDATVFSGIWNGIYTTMSATPLPSEATGEMVGGGMGFGPGGSGGTGEVEDTGADLPGGTDEIGEDTTVSGTSPKTADTAPLYLVGMVCAVALCGLAVTTLSRRRIRR